MTTWNLRETPDGIRIEHGGVFLGLLKRATLTIHDGRFDKGESPVFNWQPRFTVVVNSPFEPAWDFAGADLRARALDDARAELTGSFKSRDGRLGCAFTVIITVEESGRVSYHARQSLDILGDYALSDYVAVDERISEVTRQGPATFLEYTDPVFPESIGPATPFTHDWPEMTWPLPLFRKAHRKWWQMTAYRHESGRVVGRYHSHFISPGLMPLHRKDGWIGFFLEKDRLNPVIVPDPANELQSFSSLCPWAYDIHVGYMLPTEKGRCILRAGQRFEAAYRFLAHDGNKAAELLAGVDLQPLTPGELQVLDRPAYRAGLNTLRDPLRYPNDESLPWHLDSGAAWDKTVGHGDTFSIRLESKGASPACCLVDVGRDRFMDPLVEGATYELRAWVKTENVTGPGVRLGLAHAVAKYPGVTGEALPIEQRWSEPVTGTRDWTRIVVKGLPVPKDTMVTNLRLELDGTGRAWIDDVELALVGG
jgi:hypothetical protein